MKNQKLQEAEELRKKLIPNQNSFGEQLNKAKQVSLTFNELEYLLKAISQQSGEQPEEEVDFKKEFFRESGIDLTDYDSQGKFPKITKGKWGSIPRGLGWQEYAQWLELKATQKQAWLKERRELVEKLLYDPDFGYEVYLELKRGKHVTFAMQDGYKNYLSKHQQH